MIGRFTYAATLRLVKRSAAPTSYGSMPVTFAQTGPTARVAQKISRPTVAYRRPLVTSGSGPAELLGALSAALVRVGCRWYLFGAQAVTIWGRPRLTTDVDVTVEIASGATEEFVSTIRSAGFHLTRPEGAPGPERSFGLSR